MPPNAPGPGLPTSDDPVEILESVGKGIDRKIHVFWGAFYRDVLKDPDP